MYIFLKGPKPLLLLRRKSRKGGGGFPKTLHGTPHPNHYTTPHWEREDGGDGLPPPRRRLACRRCTSRPLDAITTAQIERDRAMERGVVR